MKKQVYDLTPADLAAHATWVFPMDELVEDEATVRPLGAGEIIPSGIQRIVRAAFRDASGKVFPGYVYTEAGSQVEDSRPVAWCDSVCITFWNGVAEPSPEFRHSVHRSGIRWPVTYETLVDGAPSQTGKLDGLYYVSGGSVRCVRGGEEDHGPSIKVMDEHGP